MNITIFGSGYVGLVSGACLADSGHHVTCVDIDEAKISKLKNGIIPIYEPGLEELIHTFSAAGRLKFTTNSDDAVKSAEIIFIAVGTPPDEDGQADMQYVLEVAKTIGESMDDYKIVIDKSTVPVGTAEKVQIVIQKMLDQRGVSIDFAVCSNPEFLKEGSAIDDFKNCDRVVIGTNSENVRNQMKECYKEIPVEKLIFMSVRSAELTKYAANAMLATKISFMNEMSNIAEHLGVDIEEVRLGIASDKRIGHHFMNPGCGYGGSCFPKDVSAITYTALKTGYKPNLLLSVEEVNHSQKYVLFKKLKAIFSDQLEGKTIAIWGLAFKPNTDDMREAPSRVLMESIWQERAKVQAYDPVAMQECSRIYGERENLKLCSSKELALKNADVLIVCTEWDEFKNVDLTDLRKKLKNNFVIDGRNIFEPSVMAGIGFEYYAIGRGLSLNK